MRLAKAVLVALAAAGMSAVTSAAHAQSSRVTVPDTPAGTTLRAWLDAFNSGDSLRLDAYHRQYDPGRPGGTTVRRETGGVDLISVERAEPRHIEVTLKERNGPRVASFVHDLIGRLDERGHPPAGLAGRERVRGGCTDRRSHARSRDRGRPCKARSIVCLSGNREAGRRLPAGKAQARSVRFLYHRDGLRQAAAR